jgi:hypothetical protein
MIIIRTTRTVRALLALVAAAPLLARAASPAPAVEPDAEVIAEALFLCDPLPPGGRDLNVSLTLARSEADAGGLTAASRIQLATALGPRLGLTADVGLGTGGAPPIHTPTASLKVLLRAPAARRTGLAASLDLLGPERDISETEVGMGLGAIRSLGPVALRASTTIATPVASWSPHLHGGGSAAVALGGRWRGVLEAVADLSGGALAVSAGPVVKLALGTRHAVTAGALLPLGRPGAAPFFALQLGRSM